MKSDEGFESVERATPPETGWNTDWHSPVVLRDQSVPVVPAGVLPELSITDESPPDPNRQGSEVQIAGEYEPSDGPAEKPIEKPSPAEKPTEKPEKPIEKPSDRLTDKPAERLPEKPSDKPLSDKPATAEVKPVERPAVRRETVENELVRQITDTELRRGYERLLNAPGGSALVDSILRIPESARAESGLTRAIQNNREGTLHEIRDSYRRANTLVAIDTTLPENLRPIVRRMVATPEGLNLAQRIVVIPPQILRDSPLATQLQSDRPLQTTLQSADFRSALIRAEESMINDRTSRMPAIPSRDEIFSRQELIRLREIEYFQRHLERIEGSSRLSEQQVTERVAAYRRGEGAARETLPPGGTVRQDRVLHLVVGLPGAGKSSALVNPLQERYGARLIDTDQVQPDLPGYRNGLGNSLVRGAGAQVTERLYTESLSRGENIVYPTLGGYPDFLHSLIERARAQGYRVAIHLADIPPAESARRVYNRGLAEPTPNLPGNDTVRQIVPPEVPLTIVGHSPSAVFDVVTTTPGLVDAWSRVDTTGRTPRVAGQSNMEVLHALVPEPSAVRPSARVSEGHAGSSEAAPRPTGRRVETSPTEAPRLTLQADGRVTVESTQPGQVTPVDHSTRELTTEQVRNLESEAARLRRAGDTERAQRIEATVRALNGEHGEVQRRAAHQRIASEVSRRPGGSGGIGTAVSVGILATAAVGYYLSEQSTAGSPLRRPTVGR